MDAPGTLLVVTPRERFDHALPALERLLANTEQEHDLLYLDAFLPGSQRRGLRRLQRQHGFRRLSVSHRATPNQARNRALREAGAYAYVVFLNNDIDVECGWLRALVSCAEETGADVYGPLCLEWLDRLGPLDEGLLSLFEHGDVSMSVRAAGARISLEPSSVVTYVLPRALGPSDLIYFRRRWSEGRRRASVAHFQRKWDVSLGSPGLAAAEGFNRWQRRLPLRLLKRRVVGLLGRHAADA